MSLPLVVFDLDGTLVDTAPDLVASLNHAVTQAGIEPVTYADLTHLVGHGARAMIERTFALRGRTIAEEELTWQMKEFVDFYHGSMPGESLPYPGLIEALDRLQDAGLKLAVCTNKPEMLAKRLLEGLGLLGRFAAISGGDTFTVRKPHADHLLSTVSNAGGWPNGRSWSATVSTTFSSPEMPLFRRSSCPSAIRTCRSKACCPIVSSGTSTN